MRRHAVLMLIVVMMITACSSPKSNANPTSATATPAPALAPTASPSPSLAPDAPKSDDLINAALDNGMIDPETALTYKVYAQFKDSRLPTEYRGGADLNTDSHILDEVEAKFSDLSPETRTALLPFLEPPIYKGAWEPPPASEGTEKVETIEPPCNEIERDKWDSTSAMHSPVRFWWLKSRPDDAAVANRFMLAMDDEIWPKLTTLMGREPLPDGNAKCNGGDPSFDIYITPEIERSYAIDSPPPGCRNTPSYIVMNPGVKDAILAHEFMHAIQWSYNTSADCMYSGEYAWLAEATATWTQDYIYPDDNGEHKADNWFYDSGQFKSPPSLPLTNDKHEYGDNLFFFYLTHHFDQPDIVRTAWDNTTSMKSVDAVDRAIPGGLDSIWGDFAVENIIEPPYDHYQIWDQLNVKPGGTSLIKGEVKTNYYYDVTESLQELAIQYVWFTFSDDIRLVTYFNGLSYKLTGEPVKDYMGTIPINGDAIKYKFEKVTSDQFPGLKIQAYFKVAGDVEWQLEDWTDKPYMTFCRDAQSERLTDLIIITSNSAKEDDVYKTGDFPSRLETSDIGCWRYGGTASVYANGYGERGYFEDNQNLPNVAFERTETHPNIPYPILHFKVAEGQYERSYHFQNDDGCVGDGKTQTTLGAAPAGGFGNDLFVLYGVTGNSARRYGGEANADQSVTLHAECPDNSGDVPVSSLPWFYTDVLSQMLKKVYTVRDGGTINGSGDLLEEAGNAEMTYEWKFEPLAESMSSGKAQDSSGEKPGGQAGSGGSGGGQGDDDGEYSPIGNGSPIGQGASDIPNYPNAESSTVQSGSGMTTIVTSDSVEKVIQFYKEQLKSPEWTDMSNPTLSNDDVTMLMFAKQPKIVTIMISTLDGKTQIMIKEVGG